MPWSQRELELLMTSSSYVLLKEYKRRSEVIGINSSLVKNKHITLIAELLKVIHFYKGILIFKCYCLNFWLFYFAVLLNCSKASTAQAMKISVLFFLLIF